MFLPLYLRNSSVSEVNIGGLLSVYSMMMPVIVLTLGILTDRTSCKKLIITGSCISAVYCLFMPFTTNMHFMLLLISLGGIGFTLSFISVYILFLKMLHGEKQAKPLSIFVGATTAGYAFGSAFICIFIKEMGMPVSWIFFIALPINIICLYIALKLPEAPIEKFPIIKYLHDMNKLPVLCVAFVAFATGIHWGAENLSVVRYMSETLQSSGYKMSLFFIVSGSFIVLLARVSGHLIHNEKSLLRIIVPGMIFSGLFQLLTYYGKSFPQFLFFRVLHTCGDGVVNFCIPMWLNLVFIKSRIGGNFGFNRTILSAGTMAGSILSGYLVAKYSLGMPFMATGLIQIVAAAILWSLRSRLGKISGIYSEKQ